MQAVFEKGDRRVCKAQHVKYSRLQDITVQVTQSAQIGVYSFIPCAFVSPLILLLMPLEVEKRKKMKRFIRLISLINQNILSK